MHRILTTLNRLLSLLLVLLLPLAGCGGGDNDNDIGSPVTPVNCQALPPACR